MGRKRKEEPVNYIQAAVENLRKDKSFKSPVFTGSTVNKTWKYIDFIDPKTGGPCLPLEWLFGCRGVLAGRIMKVEAFEGIGKSSYCFLQYAMAQQSSNAVCCHFESENTPPPPDYISAFGVDTDNLLVMTPASLEEALTDLERTMIEIKKGMPAGHVYPIVAAIDSISGLSEDDYDEKDVSDPGSQGGLGKHARMMSQWFRKRIRMLESHNTFLIVVAQLKDKISTEKIPVFGSNARTGDGKTATIADKPLNFHSTYRIKMASSKLIVDGADIGEVVRFRTIKNKLSPKHREIAVQLIRDHGTDFTEPTIDWLKAITPLTLKNGYAFSVETAGPWLKCPAVLGDQSLKSNPESKAELLARLYENTDLLMNIREALRIRGFHFDFEENYRQSNSEVEDSLEAPGDATAPEEGEKENDAAVEST